MGVNSVGSMKGSTESRTHLVSASSRCWWVVIFASFLLSSSAHDVRAQTQCPRMEFMTYSQDCPACPTPIPTYTPHPPTIAECQQTGVCPFPTSPPQPPQDPICLNRTTTEFLADCPPGTLSKAGVASCCPVEQLLGASTGTGSSSGSTGQASSGMVCCISDPAPTATPNPADTPSACGTGRSTASCAGSTFCCKNADGTCYNGYTDAAQGLTGYEGPHCRPDGILQWNCSGAFACDPIATPTPTACTGFNVTVQLCGGDRSACCRGDEFILDCMERNGINLPFTGRAGADENEIGFLVSGQVDQRDQTYLNDTEIASGLFMYSVAYPLSDVVFRVGRSAVGLSCPPPATPTPTATPVQPTPTSAPTNSDGSGCQCAYDFLEVSAAQGPAQCEAFCQSGGMWQGTSSSNYHPRGYCLCTNQPNLSTCPTIQGKTPVRPNNNTAECPADGCLAFDCLLPRVQNGDICPGQLRRYVTTGNTATCSKITRSPATSASATCDVTVSTGGSVGQNQDISICYVSPYQ